MSELTRRDLLRMLGAAVASSAVPLTPLEVALAQQRAELAVAAAGAGYLPRWFTPHEYRTVRLLVDLVLPRDERSGSATDAGVPEFMDFLLGDLLGEREETAATIRGGLAWLDHECHELHGTTFLGSSKTSKIGVADLEYRGNTVIAEWSGCPPEALHKLGVTYEP